MKNIFVILALVLLLAQTGGAIQFGEMVDYPTAGTMSRGSYAINLRMQPVGGLLLGFSFGLFDRLNFGFSYGGDNIIGYGSPHWNPQPGLQVKYRFWDESYWFPAIAVGFNNQGYGPWGGSRYLTKSPGFVAVASKNYRFLGTLSFHGGANYSIEDRNNPDNTVNFFGGLEKSLNPELWLVAEYDLALNDNLVDQQYGEGYGYLNGGLRWLFSQRLMLEFDLKNILRNGGVYTVQNGGEQPSARIGRTVKISYFDSF